jgi:hypothetical protein
MNDLEGAVRPFLEPMIQSGAQTVLAPAQRQLLARWTCKTAMVFEFTTPAPPFFTFRERDALRTTGQLPNGSLAFLINIAHYGGAKYLSTFWGTKLALDVEAGPDRLTLHGYYATISVGQLLVQLTVVRTPIPMDGIWLPVDSECEPYISKAWPVGRSHDESLVWPGSQSLDDTTIQNFMRYDVS